uniref:hypothetical protein n=1 Tax=Bradyrhizobium sp. ARR65 TaxID=1040989 RepID=UPI001AECF4EA
LTLKLTSLTLSGVVRYLWKALSVLKPRLFLAQSCRNSAVRQVGSYLGYTGLGANPFGKAARDPTRTLGSVILAELFVPRLGQYEAFG